MALVGYWLISANVCLLLTQNHCLLSHVWFIHSFSRCDHVCSFWYGSLWFLMYVLCTLCRSYRILPIWKSIFAHIMIWFNSLYGTPLNKQETQMGGSINGGYPNSWMLFVRENPNRKWMMTRGTPMTVETPISVVYSSHLVRLLLTDLYPMLTHALRCFATWPRIFTAAGDSLPRSNDGSTHEPRPSQGWHKPILAT